MGKKISFVSSKNRGITLDMLVVKDFFRVNDEKVEFKDVVANENAKIPFVKRKHKHKKGVLQKQY